MHMRNESRISWNILIQVKKAQYVLSAQQCSLVVVTLEKITNFHKFVSFVQKESVIIIIIIIITTLYYNFV